MSWHHADRLADPRRRELIAILRNGMTTAEDRPFTLSSGSRSWVRFDAAAAVCDGDAHAFVVQYLLDSVDARFDAIGGPALGAGPLVYVAGAMARRRSFEVRPDKKPHGDEGWFKGRFVPGDRILAVEDVISTGSSLFKAMRTIRSEGGIVVAVATLIDRGNNTGGRIAGEFGVPYFPLTTYADFAIEPVATAPPQTQQIAAGRDAVRESPS